MAGQHLPRTPPEHESQFQGLGPQVALPGTIPMFSVRQILAPVVFTRQCVWSGRYADHLAKEFDSQLIFLHVSDGDVQTRLEEFVASEIRTPGHRAIALDGDPAERIIQLASEYGTDLIVMPTYHARFRTFLLGSVTAKVLHDVEYPVLTGVHSEPVLGGHPNIISGVSKSVVCALDDAPGCVPVYNYARGLSERLKARLHVIHAIPGMDESSQNCGERELCKYFKRTRTAAFRAHFGAQPELPEIELVGGDIATAVRESALAQNADLLVIGRGHTNRNLGRLRTSSYAIIRKAPCPVISV